MNNLLAEDMIVETFVESNRAGAVMAADEISKTEPVRLVEDSTTGDRFLIYSTDRGIRVELRYEGATLWMTQAQMAELFGVDRTVITKHIKNVYDEGELVEGATSAKFAQVRNEGSRQVTREIQCYDINAIISVGYRVSSRQATMFRVWATDKLMQFATKGFVVDVERLKEPDSQDRVAELREIIRDIRSDEKNVYRELRSICAMCQDYDGGSESWRDFYQKTQAKLIWAVVSKTPAEVLVARADAAAPDMGLRTWPKDNIRKQDVKVTKNYLAEGEVRELNRLTAILLDIFEDQLDIGKLTMMADAERLLDRQLKQLNRSVLRTGGSVSSVAAASHADEQYEIYDRKRRELRHAQADADIAELRKQENAISGSRRRSKKND
jgi:hypothetical protein